MKSLAETSKTFHSPTICPLNARSQSRTCLSIDTRSVERCSQDLISGVEPFLHFFPHARSISVSHNLAIKHLSPGCGRVSHYVAMTGPNLHLDGTIGCFFVGMVFAIVWVQTAPSLADLTSSYSLYGCTCSQVLYYFWQYPEDRIKFKLFVSIGTALAGHVLTRTSRLQGILIMVCPSPHSWKSTNSTHTRTVYIGRSTQVPRLPTFRHVCL